MQLFAAALTAAGAFAGAVLSEAIFSRAVFSGADVSGATLAACGAGAGWAASVRSAGLLSGAGFVAAVAPPGVAGSLPSRTSGIALPSVFPGPWASRWLAPCGPAGCPGPAWPECGRGCGCSAFFAFCRAVLRLTALHLAPLRLAPPGLAEARHRGLARAPRPGLPVGGARSGPRSAGGASETDRSRRRAGTGSIRDAVEQPARRAVAGDRFHRPAHPAPCASERPSGEPIHGERRRAASTARSTSREDAPTNDGQRGQAGGPPRRPV
ncbi:hypothetical protein DK412_00330 [Methylobacterium sp. 17Sr1-1]|nr:hypothetical protein DK412_00330 [Methylobacterium sp. 17Sr1-1]